MVHRPGNEPVTMFEGRFSQQMPAEERGAPATKTAGKPAKPTEPLKPVPEEQLQLVDQWLDERTVAHEILNYHKVAANFRKLLKVGKKRMISLEPFCEYGELWEVEADEKNFDQVYIMWEVVKKIYCNLTTFHVSIDEELEKRSILYLETRIFQFNKVIEAWKENGKMLPASMKFGQWDKPKPLAEVANAMIRLARTCAKVEEDDLPAPNFEILEKWIKFNKIGWEARKRKIRIVVDWYGDAQAGIYLALRSNRDVISYVEEHQIEDAKEMWNIISSGLDVHLGKEIGSIEFRDRENFVSKEGRQKLCTEEAVYVVPNLNKYTMAKFAEIFCCHMEFNSRIISNVPAFWYMGYIRNRFMFNSGRWMPISYKRPVPNEIELVKMGEVDCAKGGRCFQYRAHRSPGKIVQERQRKLGHFRWLKRRLIYKWEKKSRYYRKKLCKRMMKHVLKPVRKPVILRPQIKEDPIELDYDDQGGTSTSSNPTFSCQSNMEDLKEHNLHMIESINLNVSTPLNESSSTPPSTDSTGNESPEEDDYDTIAGPNLPGSRNFEYYTRDSPSPRGPLVSTSSETSSTSGIATLNKWVSPNCSGKASGFQTDICTSEKPEAACLDSGMNLAADAQNVDLLEEKNPNSENNEVHMKELSSQDSIHVDRAVPNVNSLTVSYQQRIQHIMHGGPSAPTAFNSIQEDHGLQQLLLRSAAQGGSTLKDVARQSVIHPNYESRRGRKVDEQLGNETPKRKYRKRKAEEELETAQAAEPPQETQGNRIDEIIAAVAHQGRVVPAILCSNGLAINNAPARLDTPCQIESSPVSSKASDSPRHPTPTRTIRSAINEDTEPIALSTKIRSQETEDFVTSRAEENYKKGSAFRRVVSAAPIDQSTLAHHQPMVESTYVRNINPPQLDTSNAESESVAMIKPSSTASDSLVPPENTTKKERSIEELAEEHKEMMELLEKVWSIPEGARMLTNLRQELTKKLSSGRSEDSTPIQNNSLPSNALLSPGSFHFPNLTGILPENTISMPTLTSHNPAPPPSLSHSVNFKQPTTIAIQPSLPAPPALDTSKLFGSLDVSKPLDQHARALNFNPTTLLPPPVASTPFQNYLPIPQFSACRIPPDSMLRMATPLPMLSPRPTPSFVIRPQTALGSVGHRDFTLPTVLQKSSKGKKSENSEGPPKKRQYIKKKDREKINHQQESSMKTVKLSLTGIPPMQFQKPQTGPSEVSALNPMMVNEERMLSLNNMITQHQINPQQNLHNFPSSIPPSLMNSQLQPNPLLSLNMQSLNSLAQSLMMTEIATTKTAKPAARLSNGIILPTQMLLPRPVLPFNACSPAFAPPHPSVANPALAPLNPHLAALTREQLELLWAAQLGELKK